MLPEGTSFPLQGGYETHSACVRNRDMRAPILVSAIQTVRVAATRAPLGAHNPKNYASIFKKEHQVVLQKRLSSIIITTPNCLNFPKNGVTIGQAVYKIFTIQYNLQFHRMVLIYFCNDG